MSDVVENKGSVPFVQLVTQFVANNWRLPAWGAGGGVILAILVIMLGPVRYSASTILGEIDNSALKPQSGLTNLIPTQLAQIAGLGDISTSKLDEFKVAITSVTVAQTLTDKYPEILRTIFSGQWDAKKKVWRPSRGLVSRLSRLINAALGLPPWHEPDGKNLAKYLSKTIEVSPIRGAPMFHLTYSNKDPRFARDLLSRVIFEADDFLKMRDRERAIAYKAYAVKQLSKTTLSENRLALTAALSRVEQSLMVLESNLPYVVAYVDPPYVGDLPSWPRPFFQIFLYFVLGGILGALVSIVKSVRVSAG